MQKKLVVGSSRDPLEREADARADRVMRMSDSSITQAEVPATSGSAGSVQGKCASCTEEDEKRQTLRRSAATPSGPTMVSHPIVHEVLRSSGSPLDAVTRDFMETRFNHDFSRVRVHADAMAAESARQVNAHAYTVGSSIVFGHGQYAPGTSTGRHRLAHELAHTVQQEHSGAALLQRAEVDDSSNWCRGLDDIGSKVDEQVNSKLAEARKAAPSGFQQDPKKHDDFLADAKKRLSEIELWVDWQAEANKHLEHSGTKYEGSAALTAHPGALSPVVNVGGKDGICVGSDKFGHFFQDGWNAYKEKSPEAASLASIDNEIGSQQGLGLTGVFSQADIAANLAGRNFWQTLDKDPQMKFKIGSFITREWNEVNNPSYYTKDLAKVVWKNILESNWTGIATFPGYQQELDVTFKNADMSKSTLEGDYQEKTISNGSDPWNQTLTMGGEIRGEFKLSTTKVKGAETAADVVDGFSMSVNLDMSAGPDRVGSFKSVGERTLTGEWSEDDSGDPEQRGTWRLERP